ncbi:MAG: hypothetical protein GC155_02180 [Alphaproteobacteria bacterium]|nr:hypothetical protein [Alphaproteobacteria bacterium]
MCGKFTQMASWADATTFFNALGLMAEGEPVVVATPMRFAKIIRLSADGQRELVPMRWGFPDRAASNPSAPKHMHARCETIDQRPTFAESFRSRRGILMVETFNEGEELPSGKTKQWVIRPRDRKPIAIAVIYEEWINDLGGKDEQLLTFVQVTTPASALISKITDRMPAILPPADWPKWLGEIPASPGEVKALLKTFDDGGNWEMSEQATAKRKQGLLDGQRDLFS